MNALIPRTGWILRRILLVLPLTPALGSVGCKGSGTNGGDRSGLLPRGRDPLMGADRIPPAGVPIPGKESGTAARDPLFRGTAASRSGAKEPFRLTDEFTPAALSVRGNEHTDSLVIDDRRPLAVPAGGGVKPAAGLTSSGGNWEQLVEELRRVGGKPFAPVKLPGGEYEFRCSVPLDTSGAMRQYTGTGASPLAAVRDVYEQVRAERR